MKLHDIKIIKYSMPEGWYRRFGRDYIKELDHIIKEEHLEKDFEIGQIKEKFGELRSYLYPETEKINAFTDKYELLSIRTCINCGNNATYLSTDWIAPYCEQCASAMFNKSTSDDFNKMFKKTFTI